jgi:hypothetical protein
MTRPVAEILEQTRREHWPTSFIDAMANHHLCDTQPYSSSFTGHASPREDGQADAR